MMQHPLLNLPHIDARTQQPTMSQAALLRFDDAAIMFTASWGAASMPVPRPDGAYRRQYLVQLIVPGEHRQRAFHRVRSAVLYVAEDRDPIVASDFGGVHSIDDGGITVALFADELCWTCRHTAPPSWSFTAELSAARP